MRIGIDLMGGDAPPESLFPAILEAAEALGNPHSFLVIATKSVVDQLQSVLEQIGSVQQKNTILFQVAKEAIAMADLPLQAVRQKKDSSLVLGVRLLKKGILSALVSCGNTGALIAATALCLPMLPNMERPGLLALLPTLQGNIAVLDVGGNVQCKARHLVQFARFGAAYQQLTAEITRPRVGLLNIGAESKKGRLEICQAYEMLVQSKTENIAMDFVGNVEARDIFAGAVDVLVTDGFTGNVLLKASEGVASFIFTALSQAVQNESVDVKKIIEHVHKQFNYTEYPGAIICGIDGVVLKAHGNSSSKSLFQSILKASKLIEHNTISTIKTILSLPKQL